MSDAKSNVRSGESAARRRRPKPVGTAAKPFLVRFAGKVIELPARLDEVVHEPARLRSLMIAEKERRGVQQGELVFVGVSDVAHWHWCGMQSILQSRAEEQNYFGAYLLDRIAYFTLAGATGARIGSDEDLLKLAESTKDAPIQELVAKLKPDPIPEAVRRARSKPRRNETARAAGLRLELERAERYPRFRWSFPWEGYMVGGVADGLTADFVYEFKTSGDEYLGKLQEEVAFAQADMYGYFFRRSRKRVQLFLRETEETKTWDVAVNEAHAVETLRAFQAVDRGAAPQPPIPAWKCGRCRFRDTCPLLAQKGSG